MAFISLLLVAGVFAMLAFGIFCLILAAVLLVLNRRRKRKWMKITGIVSGVLAVLNLGAVGLLALMIWVP